MNSSPKTNNLFQYRERKVLEILNIYRGTLGPKSSYKHCLQVNILKQATIGLPAKRQADAPILCAGWAADNVSFYSLKVLPCIRTVCSKIRLHRIDQSGRGPPFCY